VEVWSNFGTKGARAERAGEKQERAELSVKCWTRDLRIGVAYPHVPCLRPEPTRFSTVAPTGSSPSGTPTRSLGSFPVVGRASSSKRMAGKQTCNYAMELSSCGGYPCRTPPALTSLRRVLEPHKRPESYAARLSVQTTPLL